MGRYVTGFLGRRDGFQVPIALAEAGMLSRFVTGAYQTGLMKRFGPLLPGRYGQAMKKRFCSEIPEELVDSQLWIELLQNVSRLVGDRSSRSWLWANQAISRCARDLATRLNGDLLLYEPYAAEAFSATYSHEPRKVLFHFHLHPCFERRLLDHDLRDFPPSSPTHSWLRTDAKPENDDRIVNLWKQADLVLAASTFTKQSLVDQGMPPEKCAVVPYGIDASDKAEVECVPSSFSALFVGSGIQRKGLHHLLLAWKDAKLPRTATLTIVCRSMDPAMRAMLATVPANVVLLNGVSTEELKGLFRTSSLFVMPSIAEGFGQVYLEALSLGCPVLGTPNTCLPDLGNESNGIFLTPVGDHRVLARRLEELSGVLTQTSAQELRRAATQVASQFSLKRFRLRLIEVLESGDRELRS